MSKNKAPIPSKSSLPRKMIAGTAAAAVLLIGAGKAIESSSDPDKVDQDKAAAAEIIATRMYLDPEIQSVSGTDYENSPFVNEVKLKLKLPIDPKTAKYMKKYAADDSGVSWWVPSEVHTRSIHRDDQGITFGDPEEYISDGGASVKMLDHDTGVVSLVLDKEETGDTEEAIYVTNRAFSGSFDNTVNGGQFVGVVKLPEGGAPDEWVSVPREQLILPSITVKEKDGAQ